MTTPTERKQLLLVEDDPDQRNAIQDRLKLYGYAVACAGDGLTAMDMLQTDPFDGMLLDLNLPEKHGSEVLLQTRARFPEMPVLLMSASQSGIRAAKAAHGEACAYLMKPFGVRDFETALHSCFGQTRT